MSTGRTKKTLTLNSALLLSVMSLSACAENVEDADTTASADTTVTSTVETVANGQSVTECDGYEYEQAVRWLQQSTEAAALQMQTYRLATERLAELNAAYEASGANKPAAIVTDLDETVIDNTALLAAEIANCVDYSDWDRWEDWELSGHPTLIPGALEFLTAADAAGISIFYISDRYEDNKDATVATLQELELPQVDDTADNVLLLGEPKLERRASVEADYEILMLLGDTMHDFDAAYAKDQLPESASAQKEQLNADAEHLGYDWIVLPNPSYGTWSNHPLTTWEGE